MDDQIAIVTEATVAITSIHQVLSITQDPVVGLGLVLVRGLGLVLILVQGLVRDLVVLNENTAGSRNVIIHHDDLQH